MYGEKRSASQIFLKSCYYSFLPFGGLILIFAHVLAAQESAGQGGPKFKMVRQSVWKNNLRAFKKIGLFL